MQGRELIFGGPEAFHEGLEAVTAKCFTDRLKNMEVVVPLHQTGPSRSGPVMRKVKANLGSITVFGWWQEYTVVQTANGPRLASISSWQSSD